MDTKSLKAGIGMLLVSVCATTALAQQTRPDPAKLVEAQKTAMAALAFMDGNWRGKATTTAASGEKLTITQTERIGPMLDGALKVIEGRGYAPDGKLAFNSFGTISFNPTTSTYTLRSHAMGRSGDFAVTAQPNGFSWEIPAGPMTIRYTATIKDGVWREVGDRIEAGKEPVRFFEMELKRLGDSTWPAAGTVGPQ